MTAHEWSDAKLYIGGVEVPGVGDVTFESGDNSPDEGPALGATSYEFSTTMTLADGAWDDLRRTLWPEGPRRLLREARRWRRRWLGRHTRWEYAAAYGTQVDDLMRAARHAPFGRRNGR